MTVVAGTEYCPAVLATAIKTGNFPLKMSGVHMSMMATMMSMVVSSTFVDENVGVGMTANVFLAVVEMFFTGFKLARMEV